jgi:16S rRNA (guanine966-N2)-methyltransferase
MTVNSRKNPNRVRIIGGQWRSRVLQFPETPGLRPTGDRVRETLFNWLQFQITGARCLDLFAGSGVLGFEAISRGAAQVTSLETDNKAAAAIRANCHLLGTDKLNLVQTPAPDWLQHANPARHDIVFLDPPFAAGLHESCCTLLDKRGWLAPGALVYIEAAQAPSTFTLPATWTLLREKRAGEVYYSLFSTSQHQ